MTKSSVHPAVRFLTGDDWDKVGWSGTTFQWHPTSAAPPVMGLLFDDAETGRTLFQRWIDVAGNYDSGARLHVTILTGEFPGSAPGYIVHLCPDYQSVFSRQAGGGEYVEIVPAEPVFRAAKMDYQADTPPMLERFRQEYAKHGEYLLAPALKSDDGRFYFDVEHGIVLSRLNFLTVDDIEASLVKAGLDEEIVRLLLRVEAVGGDRGDADS